MFYRDCVVVATAHPSSHGDRHEEDAPEDGVHAQLGDAEEDVDHVINLVLVENLVLKRRCLKFRKQLLGNGAAILLFSSFVTFSSIELDLIYGVLQIKLMDLSESN